MTFAGAAKTVQVGGNGGVPATGVSQVVVNITSVNGTGTGLLQAWANGAPAPSGTINLSYGVTAISGLSFVPVDASGRIQVKLLFADTDVVVDVVGWISAASVTNQAYTAVAAQRVLDTRATNAPGTCIPSPCAQLTATGTGSSMTVQIAGRGGVPTSGVAAVVVNITSVSPSGAGWLTAYKAGTGVPTGSTLNYGTMSAQANTAVVALSADGKLAIKNNGAATHLLIDVQGFYADTATWAYTYDPTGLRRTKVAPDGTVTRFVWDRSGGLPLLVAQISPTSTTRYLYGPGGLAYAQVRDGLVEYLHHDQLGSTRVITNAAGATIGSLSFDAYGVPNDTTGTATTRLGYAGQYTDPETGYQYLRARFYDPVTAQFLTRDPAVSLTREPYGYTGGDPLNQVDPSGQVPILVAFAVGAIVGGGIDLGFQALENVAAGCDPFSEIDWGSVAFNGLLGGGLSVGGAGLSSGRVLGALRNVRWADDTGAVRFGGFRGGRAAESFGGTLTQDQAIPAALRWLGEGYTTLGPGRYLSANGTQGLRWGAHETRGAIHHMHFETWENGRVVWNTVAHIL